LTAFQAAGGVARATHRRNHENGLNGNCCTTRNQGRQPRGEGGFRGQNWGA